MIRMIPGVAHLGSLNPGRVDPASPAWEETRKPLAAAWQTTTGERFFTVNVHLSSKRDSSSAHGDARPPVNGHSERRALQVNVTAVSSALLARCLITPSYRFSTS